MPAKIWQLKTVRKKGKREEAINNDKNRERDMAKNDRVKNASKEEGKAEMAKKWWGIGCD